jgi:hypothetical protein
LDAVLTLRFHNSLPSQIPHNFEISRLPRKNLSWVATVLQTHKLYLMQRKKGPMRPKTAAGVGGLPSVEERASMLTPASLLYPDVTRESSPKHLCLTSAMPGGIPTVPLPELVNAQWLRKLSEKPQAMWLRRFGSVSSRAPSTSRMERPSVPPSPLSSGLSTI